MRCRQVSGAVGIILYARPRASAVRPSIIMMGGLHRGRLTTSLMVPKVRMISVGLTEERRRSNADWMDLRRCANLVASIGKNSSQNSATPNPKFEQSEMIGCGKCWVVVGLVPDGCPAITVDLSETAHWQHLYPPQSLILNQRVLTELRD